jgi:hypothetical protein
MIDRESLSRLYLSWVNDYFTIEKFAEHHGLTYEEASLLIDVAQSCFENPHPES